MQFTLFDPYTVWRQTTSGFRLWPPLSFVLITFSTSHSLWIQTTESGKVNMPRKPSTFYERKSIMQNVIIRCSTTMLAIFASFRTWPKSSRIASSAFRVEVVDSLRYLRIRCTLSPKRGVKWKSRRDRLETKIVWCKYFMQFQAYLYCMCAERVEPVVIFRFDYRHINYRILIQNYAFVLLLCCNAMPFIP